MKNIFSLAKASVLCMLLPLIGGLTSCSDDAPFFTAAEDDAPRILNTDIPTINDQGETGSLSATYDEPFHFEIIVTPADYTKVEWINRATDEVICTEKTIDQRFAVGTYELQILATTTKGKTTYRNVTLVVDGASINGEVGARWFTPQAKANISGTGISLISKVLIDGTEATDVSVSEGVLYFTLPDVGEGEFPIVLCDNEDHTFDCGKVTISSKVDAEFTETEFKTKKLEAVELTGVNLNKVKSVSVDGNEVELMYTPEFTRIAFMCPNLADGQYTIEVTDINGKAVKFGEQDYGTLIVKNSEDAPAEGGIDLVVWEGSVAARDWNTDDDTWTGLITDLINKGSITVGTKIAIEIERTADDYCLVAPINNGWTSVVNGQADPNRADISIEDGQTTAEFTVTEAGLDAMKAGGFYLTGHGYTIKKITVTVAEYTIWEGDVAAHDWNTDDSTWSDLVLGYVNNGMIKVGTTMVITIERTAADYCLVAPINNGWTSVVNGQADPNRADISIEEGQTEATFTFVEAGLNALKDGGFYLTGHGYTVKKIAIK